MPKAKYNTEEVNGVLYYSYFYPLGTYNKAGKPEYKHFRAKTQKKMDEKIEAYRKQLETGVIKSDITVEQWFEQWFDIYKKNKKETTKENYRHLFKHISKKLGGVPIQNVKHIDLQKILTAMSDEYSIKTVRSVRTLMHGVFKKAKQNGIIATDPSENLDAEGTATQHRRALTEEERERYLQTCKTHPWGTQAAFLYWFGLRRGEMLALTAEDITEDSIIINKQLTYPKNGKPYETTTKTESGERAIPIPDSARQYIDFVRIKTGSGRIFTDDKGNDLTASKVKCAWKHFIDDAFGEGTDITMHCIRHNYCTMIIEKDVNVAAAKEIMGHADIQTTLKIYTHYSANLLKSAAEKIKSL